MQVKLNRPVVLQLGLIDDDGFTRIEGEDLDNFAAELWIDDGTGGRVLANAEDDELPAWQRIEATFAELGNGEYSATFTPIVARTHYAVVRNDTRERDWSETVQVVVSDVSDITLLLGGGVTGLPA